MSRFYYESGNAREYITLKKGSYKYINVDMPDIYTPNGMRVVEVSFPEYKIYVDVEALNAYGITIQDFQAFLESSDKAFHTRFKDRSWCGEYEANRLSKKVVIV